MIRSVTIQMSGVKTPTTARMNHQFPRGLRVQDGSMMRAASWVKLNRTMSIWPGVMLPA